MNQSLNSNTSTNSDSTYWQEQREYFKEKTVAFKESKRKHIELMKEELEKEMIKYKNKNKI